MAFGRLVTLGPGAARRDSRSPRPRRNDGRKARDFHELSDYDFEQIVGDLLSVHWKVEVQSFPRGPDGGVDLRVRGPTGEPLCLSSGDELVVQCKHRPGSLLSALKSELIDEAVKDIVDKARRYILVTSARATRRSKQDVVAPFGGRIGEADVLAREDINALLRQHPQVERANIKLWLTSAGLQQRASALVAGSGD
jgi:Restriction endonuclease